MPTTSIVSVLPPGTHDFSKLVRSGVIQYGDMLHVDFGVTAMGMNTDTQHLAYVLHPGETEADVPQGLLDGLKKVNKVQDITRSQMKVGRTGDQILNATLEQLASEDIEGKIYCHAIGDWGHSAGTVIGMAFANSAFQDLGNTNMQLNRYDQSSRRRTRTRRTTFAQQDVLQRRVICNPLCTRAQRCYGFLPGRRCLLGGRLRT